MKLPPSPYMAKKDDDESMTSRTRVIEEAELTVNGVFNARARLLWQTRQEDREPKKNKMSAILL